MPTPTYDLIASQVLSTIAASVTFSSLDTLAAGYRDLIIVCDNTGISSQEVRVRFNGDTGSNYNSVSAQGNGSSTSSFFTSSSTIMRAGLTSTTGALNIIQIFDFATTDKHKSILARGNASDSGTQMHAGRWASTAAITSVEVYANADLFQSGDGFYLYGIVS